MGFGLELQEIKAINQHILDGINFLGEVQCFMRERAELEVEYARRLDALSRKYNQRKEKLDKEKEKRASASFPGSVVALAPAVTTSPPTSTSSDKDNITRDDEKRHTSAARCFKEILKETEKTGKEHQALAEALQNVLAEKLKLIAAKKDDARKKHVAFSSRLIAERDRVYGEKDKAKTKYDAACEAVEVAKNKHNRAPDEKTADKLKKRWNEEIVDCQNAKNLYVLALTSANAAKKKYFAEDIPKLLKDMEDLDISTILGLKFILQEYGLERDKLSRSEMNSLAALHATIHDMDADGDTKAFVHSRNDWAVVAASETPDFEFEASGLWKDSDQLVSDDYARIYLRNKLRKLLKRVEQIEQEIDSKKKTLEGTQRLYDAYCKDRTQGDPDDVKERILEEERLLVMLRTSAVKYHTQIDSIVKCIGEESPGAHLHSFKGNVFTIPTVCDYCHGSIWGVGRGIKCNECGYNAHLKCEMKIPPECGNTKAMVEPTSPRTSIASSINSVSSVSTIGTGAWYGGASAYVMYDYMPDQSATEEIPIHEGEVVKVLEPDDGSGWTLVGRAAGGNTFQGLVPTSYLELATSAPAAEHAWFDKSRTPSPTKIKGVRTKAVFDFERRSIEELTIKTGQVVWITEPDDGSGWVTVSDGMKEGLVPASYLSTVLRGPHSY